jgi:excisionase family DNA binding protein
MARVKVRNENNESKRFLTVAEFANAHGVREPTVLRWVRSGELPSIRLGRRVLIPADALDRLLARREAGDERG